MLGAEERETLVFSSTNQEPDLSLPAEGSPTSLGSLGSLVVTQAGET